jgi:hypothetical protein
MMTESMEIPPELVHKALIQLDILDLGWSV